jgi:hypothetical protein
MSHASLENDALLLKDDDRSCSTQKKQRHIVVDDVESSQKLLVDIIGSATFASESLAMFSIYQKCAKSIREYIIPALVLRSAVFGGVKTKSVVKNVVLSIADKSIHVPSTLRLLRLVNGTKCERGDQCFSYNLINKASGVIDGKFYSVL